MLIKSSSFTPACITVTAAVPRSVSGLPAPYQINPRPFGPSRSRGMEGSAKSHVPTRRQTARAER